MEDGAEYDDDFVGDRKCPAAWMTTTTTITPLEKSSPAKQSRFANRNAKKSLESRFTSDDDQRMKLQLAR